MRVKRADLLKVLQMASVGVSGREILEQSHTFVFAKGRLLTFNDEVFFSYPTPLELEGAVPAEDLLNVLNKLPDEEIDVDLVGSELVLKGHRRSAGLAYAAEVKLPVDSVPRPSDWADVGPEFIKVLLQAARCCGRDFAAPWTTMVHVTSSLVEACDNQRFFRYTKATGLKQDIGIPASAIETVARLGVTKVAVGSGWIHFRTTDRAVVSIRSSHEKYHPGVEKLLEMTKPASVELPAALVEMIERAGVMNETTYDAKVTVNVASDELTLTARKDTGWYKESKRIKYAGHPIGFDVNPDFLCELLRLTSKITVDANKLKIVAGPITFVVALLQRADKPTKKEQEPAATEEQAPDVDENQE